MRFNINFVTKFNLNAILSIYIDVVNRNCDADKADVRSNDVTIKLMIREQV